MESTKEAVVKNRKRPISPTRYPKIMPTYVVALAVQETLDDPQKLQLITNKPSSEKSTHSFRSISTTDSLNSTKTFTVTPTETLSSVLDIATVCEVKIDIVDGNQCGDVVEKKSPQISSYIVIDNMTADEQPKVILNAPKHIKKCKDTNRFPRKKSRKSKRVIAFKNIHFKYKKPKNGITRILEKYYEKTKLNTSNAEEIQKQIYSNILLTVVTRSQVLKTNLVNENLLTDSDRILPNDGHVTTDNPIPYKSEIINVALSIAFDKSKTNEDQTARNSNTKLIQQENLNSFETFLQNNTTELTSKPPSSEEPKLYIIDYDDLYSVNLKPKVQSNASITQEVKSLADMSTDDDTFVVTRSSSDFYKSSSNSDGTLTFISETKLHTENVSSSVDKLDNTSLVDTSDEFPNDDSEKTTLYGVLVTDNKTYSLPLTSKNINDNVPTDTKNKPELTNPIEVKINDVNYLQNKVSFLNDFDLTIKPNLKKAQKDRSDNVKNTYPKDFADMWERISLVLDVAVKRLEKTLADRIVKDIKEILIMSNQPEYKEPTIEIQRTEIVAAPVSCNFPIPKMLHKGIFVLEHHLKRDVDMYVQCDLVQQQVIDQLMLKLSEENPKPIPSSVEALKVLQPPEILKDYVEVLKPRVAQAIDSLASVEAGKVDTVTVSTATTELSRVNGFSRFKRLFTGPLTFLRVNMVVLTSVPTFFIVLFCLYGVMVIIMHAW